MVKKLTSFVALCLMGFASSASADVLLLVDLSVNNQVTISATSGLSAVTQSGPDVTGVYLQDFYSGPRASGVSDTFVSGNLRSAQNVGGANANLFTTGNTDPGLNIFSWSTDTTVSFTSGAQAFIGSATWTLPNADYLEMVAGNSSGDLYFPADDLTDLPNARILGTWQVVPEPSSAIMIGSLLVAGMFVRRRS